MKATALPCLLAAALAAAPAPSAAANDDDGPFGGAIPSIEEMEEAAREAMRRLGLELAPLMRELSEMIDELDAYDAPRRLPNGDILISRKRPLPSPAPSPEAPPDTLDL